jgi:hypothetical protein
VSPLEARYRRVLRVLPEAYRREWEDEMVATFLDSMHSDDPDEAEYLTDYGRPGAAEVASVAGLAVRLRLGELGGPQRYAVTGAAVRLAGLLGLLALGVLGVLSLIFQVAAAGLLPWLPSPYGTIPPRSGLWLAWDQAGLLWTVSYLLLLYGQWRAARWTALLALVPGVITTAVSLGNNPVNAVRLLELLVEALVVAALAAYHPGAAPIRRRGWLLALLAGADLGMVLLVVTWSTPDRLPLLDWPGLCCLGLLAAAGFHLTRRTAPLAWLYALLLVTPAVLALRLSLLWQALQSSPDHGDWLVTGVVEAVVVLACGIALLAVTRRRLRALPAGGALSWSAAER